MKGLSPADEKTIEHICGELAETICATGPDRVGPNLIALLRLSSSLIAMASDRDEFELMLSSAKATLDYGSRKEFGCERTS